MCSAERMLWRISQNPRQTSTMEFFFKYSCRTTPNKFTIKVLRDSFLPVNMVKFTIRAILWNTCEQLILMLVFESHKNTAIGQYFNWYTTLPFCWILKDSYFRKWGLKQAWVWCYIFEFCCTYTRSQIFYFAIITKEVTKTDLLIFPRFFYQEVFRICFKILHWKISTAHLIKRKHSVLGLIYDFI